LLITENDRIKLCDFGFARRKKRQSGLMTLAGTMDYMAVTLALSFLPLPLTPLFLAFFSLKSYWVKIMTRNVTYMGTNLLFPFLPHPCWPFLFFAQVRYCLIW